MQTFCPFAYSLNAESIIFHRFHYLVVFIFHFIIFLKLIIELEIMNLWCVSLCLIIYYRRVHTPLHAVRLGLGSRQCVQGRWGCLYGRKGENEKQIWLSEDWDGDRCKRFPCIQYATQMKTHLFTITWIRNYLIASDFLLLGNGNYSEIRNHN